MLEISNLTVLNTSRTFSFIMASYKGSEYKGSEGISLLNRCMDMLGTERTDGKRTAPKEGTLVDFGMGVEIQYTPALSGSRDNVQSLVDDVNVYITHQTTRKPEDKYR